ncbi:DUF3108 domain-containing protein [Persephonella atlantica]|uniref:DUF3108 domain-containing protein n=1 Tax=Persephonella atlantica TaxID=2699429 RepID=A0ABS1GET7_9AQUI|nr:DUF3108 domain-containing protein [Persephonella atlantica]MBK3331444.1 DUF3108 domain-containing protein [Persephonella atlantica]
MSLLLLLAFFSISYGAVKNCYTIRYLFFDVAKTCLSYQSKNDEIKTKVQASSEGLLRLIKNVEYSGFAVSSQDFSSKEFYFYRKEGSIREIHHYQFYPEEIIFRKTVIKGAEEKVEMKKIKNDGYIDPFTASLYYYRQIINRRKIHKKIFFNGKSYYIPVKRIKDTQIKINGKTYKAVYAEIDPSKVKVGGVIQPTGIWKIWIDKKKKILLKGILKIRVGLVTVEIKQ